MNLTSKHQQKNIFSIKSFDIRLKNCLAAPEIKQESVGLDFLSDIKYEDLSRDQDYSRMIKENDSFYKLKSDPEVPQAMIRELDPIDERINACIKIEQPSDAKHEVDHKLKMERDLNGFESERIIDAISADSSNYKEQRIKVRRQESLLEDPDVDDSLSNVKIMNVRSISLEVWPEHQPTSPLSLSKTNLGTSGVDKPYKCQVCTKEFLEDLRLKIHMRVHTGETLSSL